MTLLHCSPMNGLPITITRGGHYDSIVTQHHGGGLLAGKVPGSVEDAAIERSRALRAAAMAEYNSAAVAGSSSSSSSPATTSATTTADADMKAAQAQR